MAIDFPNSPTPNDTHTDGGRTWIWDGTTWKIYSSSTSGIGLTNLSVTTGSVGTSALSYDNTTGVFTYTPPDLSGYITSQYTLPTASTTVLGGVKVDGSSINIDSNGVISGASTYSLPTATTTVLGGVKIDGSTITINNGVITAASSSTTTNLNLTNESGDTECFPVFCGAPTNNQTPHTNTSLKFNSTSGELSAGSFKKIGGSSSEFLKADGSIDSTTYLSSNPSYALNDLSDVNTTGAINGKIIKHNGTSWVLADDLSSGSGGGSSDPVGTIVMWSGASNNLPTGYQLCNGATPVTTELQLVVGVGNTVPDLRDRFVVGAANNYNVGDKGGSTTDTVTISGSDTVNISGSDNVTISGSTGGVNTGGGGQPFAGGSFGHTHSFSGSATVNITASDTVNISGSDTVNTVPPYYALCYVIKHTSATSLSNTLVGLSDTPSSHSNGKILQSNGSAVIWVDPPTGFSGNYNDLTNKPTIPAAQIQSDWNQSTTSSLDFIKNKPTIPATQIQSDWNQSTTSSLDFIKNKPTLFSGSYNNLTDKPTIPAAQIQSDWNQSTTSSLDFIKNKPTLFSGSYDDLSNKPTLFSGSYTDLTNKPTIPSAYTDSDVDTHLNQSNPTSGHVLSWNGSDYAWVAQSGGGGLGNPAVINGSLSVGGGEAASNFYSGADDLVVADFTQDTGISIFSGTSNTATIAFGSSTFGTGAIAGRLYYDSGNDKLVMATITTGHDIEIQSSGKTTIGDGNDVVMTIEDMSATGSHGVEVSGTIYPKAPVGDLGLSGIRWNNVYANNIIANNISGSGTNLTGTTAVKQVLSTTTTNTIYYNYYTSLIDTGLEITINCASASNRILIEYTLCGAATYGNTTSGTRAFASRLVRNGSQIAGGTNGSSGNESVYSSTGHDFMDSQSFAFMDAPGVGNHTYKVQIRHHLGASYANNLCLNRDRSGNYRAASTLTCSEIVF